MPRLSIFGQIALLGFLLLSGTPGWTEMSPAEPRRTGPIVLQPPQLALLAGRLMSGDEHLRWEFCAITLDVLLETYLDELDAAAYEKASTPARRAKLARWQGATRNLAGQLKQAGMKLAEGAPFTLHVDPRRQILIVVDGQTFSVSGPNPEAEKQIEHRIIGEFCAYNDCSFLHTEPEPATAPEYAGSGVWVLHEQREPAYEVGQILRCEFSNMSDRLRKAQACNAAAVELQQLDTALQRSQALGHQIDWERLAQNKPASVTAINLVITAEGRYLQVRLPYLAAVTDADWERLIQWMQKAPSGMSDMPLIRQAERLVGVVDAN